MRYKIKIIEISDDLKSKSNHDFDLKIKIVPIAVYIYGRSTGIKSLSFVDPFTERVVGGISWCQYFFNSLKLFTATKSRFTINK